MLFNARASKKKCFCEMADTPRSAADASAVPASGLAKGTTMADGDHRQLASPWTVLGCTFLMALATGLGSVPFYFTAKLSKFSEGVAQSAAVGVMIAASYSLIHESEGLGNAWLVLGLLSGMVFIDKSQKFLDRHEEHLEFSGLRGLDAKKVVLFLGIMTLHAVGEGCGVGVSYAGPSGFPKGLLVTLAIGLHNIPEGLAVATVLASKGIKRGELTMWTVVTAIPQPLLAVPAYAFVQVFSSLFPFFAGFAAGCMIWISYSIPLRTSTNVGFFSKIKGGFAHIKSPKQVDKFLKIGHNFLLGFLLE